MKLDINVERVKEDISKLYVEPQMALLARFIVVHVAYLLWFVGVGTSRKVD